MNSDDLEIDLSDDSQLISELDDDRWMERLLVELGDDELLRSMRDFRDAEHACAAK